MILAALGAAALAAQSASPPMLDVAAGIDAALVACEQWVLNPVTHADQPQNFLRNIGLEGTLQPQQAVPDAVLPPPALRQSLKSWRVPLGAGGIFVSVSEIQPMCHIAGGGPFDLQPAVLMEIASSRFRARWHKVSSSKREDMTSDSFTSSESGQFSIVISYAAKAAERTDRVQLLATAQYDLRN